jgi:hypothetical protein
MPVGTPLDRYSILKSNLSVDYFIRLAHIQRISCIFLLDHADPACFIAYGRVPPGDLVAPP